MIRDTDNFKKCAVTRCQKKGNFVNNICDTCTKQLNKSYKERRPNRSAQLKKESNREYSKALRLAKESFQKWARLRDANEELEKRTHKNVKYSAFELMEIAKKYEALCKEKIESLRL